MDLFWVSVCVYFSITIICYILSLILILNKTFFKDTMRYPHTYWQNHPYLSLVPFINIRVLYDYIDLLKYYNKHRGYGIY